SCARPDHTAPLADADSLRGILRDRCLEGRMCDAEIGDPAEHLDQVVALVEHVDRVAQVLDWVLALEGDLAPANDPSLFHAGTLVERIVGRKGHWRAPARLAFGRLSVLGRWPCASRRLPRSCAAGSG